VEEEGEEEQAEEQQEQREDGGICVGLQCKGMGMGGVL
jgi:hypothetical protein